MDTASERAFSWHKQGLDGRLNGHSAAQVLDTAGWARSVGGANPYLSLFARAGISREQADAEVKALHIHELPTARGCTYVLGHDDFAWGLSLGLAAAETQAKVIDKLDVPRSELTALGEQVLQTLNKNDAVPLDPKQLKDMLGDSVRSLGEAGKKKGASTTLPAALSLLQADGRIRRVPVNGRLDQQRYAYTAWNLHANTETPEKVRARLMLNYLRWTGGATLKQTQWFTAFTVAQTKVALAAAGAIEHDDLWMLPEDAAARENFKAPKEEQIQLLAGTDSLFLLRRNVADGLDEKDQASPLLNPGNGLQPDLPDHPIVDRGRIVGLWQYDSVNERIAHHLFDGPTPAIQKRIKEVEDFIKEDLGDFRSFSLDSPASRQKRIDALDAAN